MNQFVKPEQAHMNAVFETQKRAYAQSPTCAADERKQHLSALLAIIERYETKLIDAVSEDFGSRSRIESMFGEIVASMSSVRLAKHKVKSWMKTRSVPTPIFMRPGHSRIVPQPLGVVGIIAPWNYPFYLALSPLASALSAGNRVMIKPSELTPNSSEIMREMLAEIFDESHVAVITGEADIGAAFAQLPFDHLLFTGSTGVGRKVASAAAENLTPVTLELGGKSPAIVHSSANIAKAARSITFGKAFNSGQTCVAPDYVLCAHDNLAAVVGAIRNAFADMYPAVETTDDYSSIVSDRHFARIETMIETARDAGVKIVQMGDAGVMRQKRKIPLTLLINPSPDLAVMQEEIFGPILPIISLPSDQHVYGYINDRDRPLALYWFGHDAEARDEIVNLTIAGGVTTNDTNWHVVQENLPFGGVGQSGYGVYHGKAGFETFSHMKPVFHQSRFANTKMMQPPYTTATEKLLGFAKRYM